MSSGTDRRTAGPMMDDEIQLPGPGVRVIDCLTLFYAECLGQSFPKEVCERSSPFVAANAFLLKIFSFGAVQHEALLGFFHHSPKDIACAFVSSRHRSFPSNMGSPRAKGRKHRHCHCPICVDGSNTK
jgi:hypothetical protein